MPHQPVTGPAATAADLAALYRVPPGTIYAWASTDRWRRTITRPRRYSMADAQASFDRRRSTTEGTPP